MSIWKMAISPENCNERCQDTMVSHLGIVFTEVGADYLVAKMPVDHRTVQPLRIMHGGASCVLAETVGSTAANYTVNQDTHYCVGLSINTSHIGMARENHGYVYATAKPYHLGRTTQVWSIEIHDEHKRLISVNRLTMAVLMR